MKITFFGSSHGVPEANRKCSCIMVEVGQNIYLIDLGTPAIDQLRRRGKSVDAVKGVFITHMHGDHTDGLIQFADLIAWYFKTPNPVIVLPDVKAEQVINSWLDLTLNGHHTSLEYRQTREGLVYDDGVVRVSAIPTQHCPGSHAYVLEAEGKTVLFTGDLANPGRDFPYMDKELDLLVCESAHFPTTDYLPVLDKQQTKNICVTHYSPKRMESLYEFQRLMKEREKPIIIATDDLELNV